MQTKFWISLIILISFSLSGCFLSPSPIVVIPDCDPWIVPSRPEKETIPWKKITDKDGITLYSIDEAGAKVLIKNTLTDSNYIKDLQEQIKAMNEAFCPQKTD